jgi:hypothetical protein
MCSAFYNGDLQLQCLNTAYITLIPKINNPIDASGFGPISLITMEIKVITKLLANRLQDRIIPLLHKNQYGFIKTKTINDCLSWAFEYINIFHKSRREIIRIKVENCYCI